MIMSMTGFGKKETQFKDKNISIEVRSLNSKNADINLRAPTYLRELDPEIRKVFINKMHRGKIDINLLIEFNGEITPTNINKSIVKAYMNQLKDIADISDSESLSLAMKLPEALSSEKGSADLKEKKVILTLFDEVIEEINDFRKNEGSVLKKDLELRLNLIEKNLKSIIKIDPVRKSKIEKKLRIALNEVNIEIDENRFEQELVFYLEKYDITEEKVRLENHINYFNQVMDNDSPNGKKLGFIAQEMGREINTIGSKANHADLQKIVVQMKDELEKIKEQLLNVL